MDKVVDNSAITAYQVRLSLTLNWMKATGTVRMKADDKYGHKKDDVVTFVRYGTYGGWDEQGRWIDFFNTEMI